MAASYEYFFSNFFSVTRDLIDHFGEEIVWLPFFHRLTFQLHKYPLLLGAYKIFFLIIYCDKLLSYMVSSFQNEICFDYEGKIIRFMNLVHMYIFSFNMKNIY